MPKALATNYRINRTFKALGLVITLAVLSACGGGGGATSTSTATSNQTINTDPSTLEGVIQASSGAPVAGVVVSSGSQTITTTADGTYKFSNPSTATSAVVLVKKAGYTTTARELPLLAGKTTRINIALFEDQVTTTFSAGSAANVNVSGASVQIPANSLKYADGGDFTGTVKMAASYYSPDTPQGVQAFAAPYSGSDAGTTSPIISMGFMEVKLSDTAGRALQLKSGSPATITMPASSNASDAASIPLWFYDEASKIWKREGQATKQANGSYSGSVAHFTIWNVDFKGARATIKGCFIDRNGAPTTLVGSVSLRSTGWSTNLFIRDARGTAPGDFTVLNVPANRPLELYSSNQTPAFSPVQIPALSEGETRDLGPCISATPIADSPIIPGPVFPTFVFTPPAVNPGGQTSGAAAFAGTYAGTYTGAENGTFVVTANNVGTITGSVFSTTFNITVPVSGQVSNTGGVTLSTGGTAGSAQFNGSINAAGVVSGVWRYFGSTANDGTFSGTRTVATVVTGSAFGIDAYVGTWLACTAVPGFTASTRERITFTKTGTATLNWTSDSTDHTTTNCTGTARGAVETETGTATIVGSKTVSSLSVDKLTTTVLTSTNSGSSGLGAFDKTIVNISGNNFRYGDFSLGFDAEGFPNALYPNPAIKQ
jgi:Carboxypeptidase regulatory-like domain